MMTRLVEAAEWRLLALLFECPAPGWETQIAALARETEDPVLRQAADAAVIEASEGTYHSLFGPGGPAPGREASYLSGVQLGYLISELTAYYNAFAFTPRGSEPPDQVPVEINFIAYLKLKEAYAESRGEAEHAAVVSDAVRSFIADHLSTIAQPLAAALEMVAPSYLVSAGQALLKRTGPPRTGTGAPGLPLDDDEAEVTCGDVSTGPETLVQLR
ncbi:MAG: molecular chaperone TorD family protein [Bryobacterales bacterium]|nr:molecular chaperone TorD family protein [Bryobacterales bacterium]